MSSSGKPQTSVSLAGERTQSLSLLCSCIDMSNCGICLCRALFLLFQQFCLYHEVAFIFPGHKGVAITLPSLFSHWLKISNLILLKIFSSGLFRLCVLPGAPMLPCAMLNLGAGVCVFCHPREYCCPLYVCRSACCLRICLLSKREFGFLYKDCWARGGYELVEGPFGISCSSGM